MKCVEWKIYRTRFLVKAKQLSSSLSFTDHLGRQHCGRKGDYLVESFDGVLSIAPRQIFEDIYVPMRNGEPDAAACEADAHTPDALPAGEFSVEALKIERIEDVGSSRIEDARPSDHNRTSRAARKSPQSVRSTPSRLSLM